MVQEKLEVSWVGYLREGEILVRWAEDLVKAGVTV